ncbi:MAG: peptidoglycan-binding protein [Cyanobacteria bacterium P01_H01_bin.58]
MGDTASNKFGLLSSDSKEILASYYDLATVSELSEEEYDQLISIYKKAESDMVLSFFIGMIDYRINQDLGLLSSDFRGDYRNQKSWLREYIQEIPFDSEYRKDLQDILKKLGYYQGPIDGVLGKRSEEALRRLYEKVQEKLAVKGFYREKASGILDENSVAAVKNFQKSENLKDDGVLGRETLERLIANMDLRESVRTPTDR